MKPEDSPNQQISSSGEVVSTTDLGNGQIKAELSSSKGDLSEKEVAENTVANLSDREGAKQLVSLASSESGPPAFGVGSSVPLVDVLKVIGTKEEPKFFSGLQVAGMTPIEGSSGKFAVQWALYFAGRSLSPNATIKITILNAVGIEVLAKTTSSDGASLWGVAIEVSGEEEVETIEVIETPENWEGFGDPVRTVFPFEPNPPTPEQAGNIREGQIFGGISIGKRAF